MPKCRIGRPDNAQRCVTSPIICVAGLGAAPRPEDDLPPECKIYIGSIPPQVDEHTLSREFARFGPVIRWVMHFK
jgi:hypothetical protein